MSHKGQRDQLTMSTKIPEERSADRESGEVFVPEKSAPPIVTGLIVGRASPSFLVCPGDVGPALWPLKMLP
jgi:hypothetical protein